MAVTSGCSAPAPAEREAPEQSSQPILGGTLDTTHQAVAALLQIDSDGFLSGACSSTTIAKKGQSGILLTAAHCVVELDAQGEPTAVPLDPSALYLVPGEDWLTALNALEVFSVVETTVHQSYDGSVESPFDIAVVRYAGALPSTPSLPILTSAADDLGGNSPLTLVGYGVTESNQDNTQRYRVDQSIYALDERNIAYDQAAGDGICQGDSGGPALYSTPGGERVAGVASYSDVACADLGVSVRVSAYETFVFQAIAAAPATLNCDECAAAAVAPGNPCRDLNLLCNDGISACSEYADCTEACATESCRASCATNNPQGERSYEDLLSCVCRDGCSQQCSSSAGCQPYTCGGLTAILSACTACMKQTCCSQTEACASDAVCAACVADPRASGCDQNPVFGALQSCRAGCAGDPCSASGSTGGAGGSASGGGGPSAGGAAGSAGGASSAGAGGAGASAGAETGEAGEGPVSPYAGGMRSPACSCNVPRDATTPWGLGVAGLGFAFAALRRSRATAR